MADETNDADRVPTARSAGESLRSAVERLVRRLRSGGSEPAVPPDEAGAVARRPQDAERSRGRARRPDDGRRQARAQQDIAETAMAMLTLWATFDESETDQVAVTTRALIADLSAEEMGYLVLHLAGVSRGVLHVLAGQDHPDVSAALQTVARGVHARGPSTP